uniref:BED-type domain-containing protein n=1 Tax=Stomoxys calcitrans TaxID=35570 RepID=A0A1I8Q944_STOCA
MSARNIRKWREEIEAHINDGTYKLAEVQKVSQRRSPVWNIFIKVMDENGCILDRAVYCRHCKRVFRAQGNSTTSLMRHNCYRIFSCVPSQVEEQEKAIEKKTKTYRKRVKAIPSAYHDANKFEYSFDFELLNTTIGKGLRGGTYVLQPNKESNDPIWSRFAFVAMKGNVESILKDVVCCNQCQTILKYHDPSGVKYLYEHECGKEDKLKISFKIKTGLYKLKQRHCSKSNLWKLFALISKDDNTVMKDYVYCTACAEILPYTVRSTKKLKTHKCFVQLGFHVTEDIRPVVDIEGKGLQNLVTPWPNAKKIVTKSSKAIYPTFVKPTNQLTTDFGMKVLQKSIEHKIRAGCYKLKGIPEFPPRSIYAFITKEDGNTLGGMVSCRQCLQILIYDGINDEELKQHAKRHTSSQTQQQQVTVAEEDIKIEETQLAENNQLHSIIIREEINFEEAPPFAQQQYSENSVEFMQSNDYVEQFVDETQVKDEYSFVDSNYNQYPVFIIEELEDPTDDYVKQEDECQELLYYQN